MYYRILIFLCLAVSCVNLGFGKTSPSGIVNPKNRLAIIIDTTKPDNNTRYKNALNGLIQTLNDTGISMSRVIVYSNVCPQEEFKPTSTNIRALMDIIRNRNLKKLKNNKGNDVIVRSNIDDIAELQIYLIAGGVSNEAQSRFMIIPSDVDEKNIKSTFDEKLISIKDEIEAAMLSTKKASMLERTLLVVNVNSVISVTRGSNHYNGTTMKDVDLGHLSKSLKNAYLVNDEEDEEDDEISTGTRQFRHMRIMTKNQSVTNSSVENFYNLLKHGIEGYADIAGNQDGIIQDYELADYIKSTNLKYSNVQVEYDFNGNASYEICNCNIEIKIPVGLFKTIGDTFTRSEYKALRESAWEREKVVKAKKNSEKK